MWINGTENSQLGLFHQQHPLDFFRLSDSASQSSRVDDPCDPLPTMSSSICGILTVLAIYKNASSTWMPSLALASKQGISTLAPVTMLCSCANPRACLLDTTRSSISILLPSSTNGKSGLVSPMPAWFKNSRRHLAKCSKVK